MISRGQLRVRNKRIHQISKQVKARSELLALRDTVDSLHDTIDELRARLLAVEVDNTQSVERFKRLNTIDPAKMVTDKLFSHTEIRKVYRKYRPHIFVRLGHTEHYMQSSWHQYRQMIAKSEYKEPRDQGIASYVEYDYDQKILYIDFI